MPNLARRALALATSAIVALTAFAAEALAGDPVRILVEPPAGVAALEPGQSIDVQVVGQDAAGARGTFGIYRVEVSATEGEFTLVQAPYRYRYVAPAQIDSERPVQLRAWLKQLPSVSGSATVRIAPARPYDRLLLRGPASVSLGGAATIEVLGVRADGTAVVVRDERVVVLLDGPGALAALSPGTHRYTAPLRADSDAARRTARITASLDRFPNVTAEMSILITRDAPPGAPPGSSQGSVARLAIELPQGVTSAEAGQTLNVLVAAYDARGARTGLGDRRIEVSATEGELVLATAPDRYRYTAPPVVARSGSTLLRAWLKQQPDVSGTATVQLLPRRTYERLVFRGATNVEPGRSIELEVLGEQAGGATVEVTDQRVLVTLDGPGTLAPAAGAVRANVWTYTAPSRWDQRTSSGSVRLVATLERSPRVTGEVSIVLGRDTHGGPPAGDVVHLVAELPPGVAEVEYGQSVDFQVFGTDASGNRVSLGERQVEASATVGEVAIVEGTSRWRYTAPAIGFVPDRAAEVRVWLKRTPDVNGTFGLRFRSRSMFGRLEVRAPATVQLGATADVEVYLTGRDGTAALSTDQRINLVLDGPGSIAPVSAGVWRYSAPPRTDVQSEGKSVRVTASSDRNRMMTGSTSFVLVADPMAVETADEDASGVLWPSRNVRLLVWRSRASREDPWPRATFDLPLPGKPLLAPGAFVRLRIQPERPDIAKIELESYVADRPGAAVRIDDADPSGRLRLVRNKLGRTHAIVETEIPSGGKPLVLHLLLTTTKGEVLREEFVLEREQAVSKR